MSLDNEYILYSPSPTIIEEIVQYFAERNFCLIPADTMVEINKNCQLVVVVLFQVLLSSVQVTQSIVDMETRPQDEDHHCHCSLKNVSLSMVNNRLQFVTEIVDSNSHYSSYFLMANVSRCYGGCAATTQKSSLVCRPTLTTLKTVAMSVPWQSS